MACGIGDIALHANEQAAIGELFQGFGLDLPVDRSAMAGLDQNRLPETAVGAKIQILLDHDLVALGFIQQGLLRFRAKIFRKHHERVGIAQIGQALRLDQRVELVKIAWAVVGFEIFVQQVIVGRILDQFALIVQQS